MLPKAHTLHWRKAVNPPRPPDGHTWTPGQKVAIPCMLRTSAAAGRDASEPVSKPDKSEQHTTVSIFIFKQRA